MGINRLAGEPEKAILVGVQLPHQPKTRIQAQLDELAALADTAGATVLSQIIQRRDRLCASTLIGSGKLSEVGQLVKDKSIQLVIFDDDLTGSQVKKIETEVACKVLDRSGLILDIFAKHARTAEAKIQVEVAQLQYMLPRLTRAWTHLSRQVGGIGTRGPGETQLEVDRRLVRKRLSDLKKKLSKQETVRQLQHDQRYPIFQVALVGYTNAGKSSLMNKLTSAGVKVEDRLFATLDATTRRIHLLNAAPSVLSDTVGFIRKLPHHLVESFKSTLSVVQNASLILQVIDASDEDFPEHMEITKKVLSDLGMDATPKLIAYNKADRMEPEVKERLLAQNPESVVFSALTGEGLPILKEFLRQKQGQYLTQLTEKGYLRPELLEEVKQREGRPWS